MPRPLHTVHPQGAFVLITSKRGDVQDCLTILVAWVRVLSLVTFQGFKNLCYTLKVSFTETTAAHTSDQEYPECVLGFLGSATAYNVSKYSWGRRYIIQCPDSPSKPSLGVRLSEHAFVPWLFFFLIAQKKLFVNAVHITISAFPLPLIAFGGYTPPLSPLWWEKAAIGPIKGGAWRSTTPQGQQLLCFTGWCPADPQEQSFLSGSPRWFRRHLLCSGWPTLLISFWSYEYPPSHPCREADFWETVLSNRILPFQLS